MSEFQQVKKRGQNTTQTSKYADEHQKLLEMGFDAASITKALETSQGNLESATAILLGEDRADHNEDRHQPYSESTKSTSRVAAASKAESTSTKGNTNGKASTNKVETLKELHHRMMATYKINKCKEGANHDKRMCMNWHSLSDRRRNPFEYTYSCFDCPTMARTGECKDGDNCQHSHTMLEKMFHPELYKISMCQRTQRGESCDRGILCAFAHNESELRIISPTAVPKVPPPVDWQPTKPIPTSSKLNTILERIATILKEVGAEGAGGTEIARKYSERWNESLELEDEQKEKYKFRDLVSTHPNITIMTNRGGPLRYLFDENRTASPSSSSAANNNNNGGENVSNGKESGHNHGLKGSADGPVSLATVRDRLVSLIKAAGSDGILGSDLPKRYQELYAAKLADVTDESGNKMKLKEILAQQPGVIVQMFKLQPKYVYDGPFDSTPVATSNPQPVVAAAAPAPVAPVSAPVVAQSVPKAPAQSSAPVAPAVSTVSQDRSAAASVVVSGKSYSSVAATIKAAAAAAELKQQQQHDAPAVSNNNNSSLAHHLNNNSNNKLSHHHEEGNNNHNNNSSSMVDDSAPSADDPIFNQPTNAPTTSRLASLENNSSNSASNNNSKVVANNAFTTSEPVSFKWNQSDSGLLGSGHGHHDDLIGSSSSNNRKSHSESTNAPSSLLVGAPGLTKIHNAGNSTLDNTPNISSLMIGGGGGSSSSTANNSSDFHERLNLAQSQIATLQQTINKLQGDLHSRNQDYETQSRQLHTVVQRLAEAENKPNNSDAEHMKQQLKNKTDELTQKTRDINKVEDELRKLREERKGDLNQFFINLSQIEDAITAMKCKEENYSDKVRSDDVQELLQFRKALRTFLSTLKGQLKGKFDLLTAQSSLGPMDAASNLNITATGLTGIPQAPRYVQGGGYDANYYTPMNPRTDAFAAAGYVGYAQPVDSGLCALPGCRNQGHYTCAGCQKVSYCGAEHQRLHWAQHSLNCHP